MPRKPRALLALLGFRSLLLHSHIHATIGLSLNGGLQGVAQADFDGIRTFPPLPSVSSSAFADQRLSNQATALTMRAELSIAGSEESRVYLGVS